MRNLYWEETLERPFIYLPVPLPPCAEHPVERVFTDALTNTIIVRMRVNRLKDPLVPPNPAPNIQRNGGKTIAIIYT